MSLRRVLATALRIIQQFARDRRTLILVLLAPLAVMLVLNSALSGKPPLLTLGVTGAGSALVSAAGGQFGGARIVTVEADRADESLRRGDVDGVLTFPEGGEPSQGLTLRVEGSDPVTAQRLRVVVEQAAKSWTPDLAGGGLPAGAPPIPIRTTYLYGGKDYTQTDAYAPYFIGLFDFLFVFLLASVAFLRERSAGTMERVLVSPLGKAELVLGYLVGFTLFAMAQAALVLLFVVKVLHIHFAGSLGLLFLITGVLTIGAINLGIFTSAFAKNELQVIQFIPVILVPQILLGGLFFPVRSLPVVLKQLAYVFPVTYANFALKDVMMRGAGLSRIWPDMLFLIAFAVLMVAAAVLSLRRKLA